MPASACILIVDDDPTLCEALTAALIPSYQVLTLATGLGTLEVVGQQSVDVVLLDYLLPDVSGLSVLQSLRLTHPSLPVILMTGFGSEDVAVEAFRGGIVDYLKKPIRPDDLLARVEHLLALGWRARRPISQQAGRAKAMWSGVIYSSV